MDEYRLDRTKFSVGLLGKPSDEKAFWLSQTPADRLRFLEYLRQVVYGYNPDTTRLQRVLELAQPQEG